MSLFVEFLKKEYKLTGDQCYVTTVFIGKPPEFSLKIDEETQRVKIETSDIKASNEGNYNLDKISVNIRHDSVSFEVGFINSQIFQLFQIQWKKILEKINIESLKIYFESQPVNLNISGYELSIICYNLLKVRNTFPVKISYSSKASYDYDKNLVSKIKTGDLFQLLCLENSHYNDEKLQITLYEPLENINYSEISQKTEEILDNYSIDDSDIKYFNFQNIRKYIRLSTDNRYFISPSVMRIKEKNYGNIFSEINSESSLKINQSLPSLTPTNKYFPDRNNDYYSSFFLIDDNEDNYLYNFNRLRALRHTNLLKIYGIHKTKDGHLMLVTEKYKESSFQELILNLSRNEKIKILKTIVRLLKFCQEREYFFLGLEFEKLFVDSYGNVKLLINYSHRMANDRLKSPEEFVGFYSSHSENFRLGLLIYRMFIDPHDEKVGILYNEKFITGNIPIFTLETLKEYPEICQIINELTCLYPKQRLDLSDLIVYLDNF